MQRHVIRLVGPGGAGKTATGARLAQRLGVTFVDLDERFAATHGDISRYLEVHGYVPYASQNVQMYLDVMTAEAGSLILTLSSGFMTYATDVHHDYVRVCCEIETMKPISAVVDAAVANLLPNVRLQPTAASAIMSRRG